ncbi:hypothetical protein PF005_g20363 [Phytophthora fragariae]|uniref:General transcription factor IIH subunit 4 n=1 Tax=Phytophthora fragariae TaxID=53985 RepID=A0A6A3WRQ4_9STRA|nr:hypothetical protein PF005_g20363 [Phytophthora fragariae]
MPGKVFVGGKVQPLGRSIDSKQLRLATSTQASPRHDENNSFRRRSRPSSSSLSSFTLALQHVRPAPRVLVFVVDGGSLLGYFAKVCIKLGDFLADFALLYLNLEAGSPVALVLVFSAITVSSALSSAVLVSLPPEKTSLLIDTLLDTLFDFLIAIAYPWLALTYCFSTFSFEYKLLEINLDIYPAGWFETVASVIADPVKTSIIRRILKSLRIVSVLDFFARVGVNLFLCVRLHYIVSLLHDPSWRKKHPFKVNAKHRYFAGALFVCLAAVVVVFVEESIRTSTLACKPHSECAVNAWRWTYLQSDSLTQCPWLTLIDGDKAPKTYAAWILPKDLTAKVAQLAATGDLQTIQLTNRFLPVLPSELRRCKQLKHVSLIYTHMMELPDWFKEFTKLEYLHIEGIPENSLESLSDDLFNNMPSLTFIHLAGHPMDAFDFLETLPPATLERLYQDPWACQAIFQALPPLAQQFVMRLLPSNAGVPRSLLEQWVVPEPGDAKPMPPQFHAALHKLEGLKVFVHQDGAYRSHPTFQKQLMYALSNLGGSPWERGRLQLPKDPENTFAAADLERYARARWDSVLHYMVGSTAVQEPPQSVVDILLRTKLLQASGADSRALHITDTGYEFMLKDIHVQMWIFMLEYIRTLDNTGTLKQEDILQFLFQISYCQTGEYYAVADLTETQRLLLGDFIDFGLLFRKRPNSDRFYTTSLAVNLIFGGSTGQKRSHVSLTSSFAGVRAGLKSQVADPRHAPTADHGAQLLVVVETNFKIYAYTTSTLHVAMLSVFVDIVARLPNLAIGFITRESLRSALIHGISAQQIYDFLMKHAHPKMRRNTPVIPENIADQIYLWERERNRVQFMEGILFDGFNTKEDYESVRDYAEDLKVLTWSDPIHFRLSIATAGIDDVRHYIQSQISSR